MIARLLLVAVGGTIGTLGRFGVAEAMGPAHSWPWPTFAVNIIGSLLLGVLAARVVDAADPRRLMLGTGLLGGFTTYSAFAVETEALLRDSQVATALLYSTSSVIVGLVAAAVGLVIARRPA